MTISLARVATDRPARYGHQLVGHMGRKITASWDEETATGRLTMDRGGERTGVCDISCEDGALILRVEADEAHVERVEHVVGIHLARFGYKDALAVSWVREDGTPGTTQGPLSAEDMARHAAEKKARLAAQSSQS